MGNTPRIYCAEVNKDKEDGVRKESENRVRVTGCGIIGRETRCRRGEVRDGKKIFACRDKQFLTKTRVKLSRVFSCTILQKGQAGC